MSEASDTCFFPAKLLVSPFIPGNDAVPFHKTSLPLFLFSLSGTPVNQIFSNLDSEVFLSFFLLCFHMMLFCFTLGKIFFSTLSSDSFDFLSLTTIQFSKGFVHECM